MCFTNLKNVPETFYKLLNDKEVVQTAIEKRKIELDQCGMDNVSIKDDFKVCCEGHSHN